MAVDPLGPPPPPTNNEPDSTTVTGSSPAAKKADLKPFNDDDGPSFSDLLDVINPLQHIPLVNTLYQHLTGDKEGAVADLVGGGLYGGFIGLGAAMVNLVVESTTGASISDNMVALVSDDDAPTAVAQNGDAAAKTAAAAASATVPPKVQVEAMADAVPAGASAFPAAASTAAASSGTDGGPVSAGDFLIFGGAAPQQAILRPPPGKPLSIGPAKSLDQPSDAPARSGDFMVFGDGAAATPTASPATASAPESAPAQSGDFMVFGANSAPAAELPMTSTPPAAAAVPAAAPAPTSNAGQPANPLRGQPRSFAAPPRRTQTTPQVLPMPTTGPAAVPGNSQASAAARAANTPPENSDWFVGAFNQAMDKYNRAASLGTASDTASPAN